MEKRREKEERKRQRASEKQNQDPAVQASNPGDLLDDELREAALEQQRLFGTDEQGR